MTVTHSNMTGIMTIYHGPTNYRGARITAYAGLKRSLTISYDHALNSDDNHAAGAQALCNKFNWTGDLRSGGHERGHYFVFCDK